MNCVMAIDNGEVISKSEGEMSLGDSSLQVQYREINWFSDFERKIKGGNVE
jgi:hypothetical protein